MKFWKSPNQLAAGLAIVLITVGVGPSETMAQTMTQTNSNIAQATRARCRQVSERRGLVVRARPTPNSPVIGRVAYNQQVTLAPNAQGIIGPDSRNWIEITNPVQGFVSNGLPNTSGNLVNCSTDVSQTQSLCRQVDLRAAPRGVVVRADPSRLSTRRGGVASGDQVQLASDYRLISDPNGEGRNWVRITDPVAGYISANTLIMCSR